MKTWGNRLLIGMLAGMALMPMVPLADRPLVQDSPLLAADAPPDEPQLPPAPIVPVPLLSPRLAVAAALNDLDQQNSVDQPFLHYLYLPYTDPDFWPALKLHVNLISREAAFAYPTQVAQGLWRVDLREYQWLRETWEKLANIDPYFHRKQVVETIREETYEQGYGYTDSAGQWHRTEVRQEIRKVKERTVKSVLFAPLAASQLAGLALLTNSQAPIVRADWFLVQGARQVSLTNRQTGAGYYDWLGLKTIQDYFDLVGLNVKTSDRIESVIRAVVGESKVAAQNRQIVRRGAQSGGEWQTLEVADQSGRGVAIQELRDGELVFNAQERYGFLPNGLMVTFLANNLDVRQDSVPDDIAGDRSALNVSNDTRVHINLACMRCHAGEVLKPIGEDVRTIYTGRLQTVTQSKAVALELQRQYGANLDRALALDRSLCQHALTEVTGGKKPQEAATAYATAFNNYAYRRVTGAMFAAELGVQLPQLEKALRDAATRLGRGDFRTDALLTPVPGTMPRLNVEDSFSDTQDLLYGVLK